MGYLSPIVIKFKVSMQALCEAKIGWDELIPEPLMIYWEILVSELRKTKAMTIPRSYLSRIDKESLSYKLCGYCDASLTGYAAALIKTVSRSYMCFMAF